MGGSIASRPNHKRGGLCVIATRFRRHLAATVRYQIVTFCHFGVKATLDPQVGVLAFCKKLVKLSPD